MRDSGGQEAMGWGADVLAKFGVGPGQWRCQSCNVVNNDKNAPKCVSCEYDNPHHAGPTGGAAAAAAPGAAGGGFVFGTPVAAAGNAQPGASGARAAAPVPQFQFGTPAPPATGFVFGQQPAAAPAAATGGGFVYSAVPAAAPAVAPQQAAIGGGFTFGSAAAPAPASWAPQGGAAAAASSLAPAPRPQARDVNPARMPRKRYLGASAKFILASGEGGVAGYHVPAEAAASREVPLRPFDAAGLVTTHGSGDCGQLGHRGAAVLSAEEMARPTGEAGDGDDAGDGSDSSGDDGDFSESLPRVVEALRGLDVARVACGGMHNAALTLAGELWTWGCNDDCALGREGDESLPARAGVPRGEAAPVQVQCGDCHTAVLTAAGRLLLCGTYKDANGYLGFQPGVRAQPALVPLALPARARVTRIACGAHHTLALCAGGAVLSWGDGQQGQLGRPVPREEARKQEALAPGPVDVSALPRADRAAAAVFAGAYHSFLIARSGAVYAWGSNAFGQLGVGDRDNRAAPAACAKLGQRRIAQIAGGQHHSLALSSLGYVYAFGRGDAGQLGVPAPDRDGEPVPLRVQALRKRAVQQIAAGGAHSLALTCDGAVFAWGYGDMLQLGNGREEDEDAPFLVAGGALAGRVPVQVSGGGQHTAILSAAAADARRAADEIPNPRWAIAAPLPLDAAAGDHVEEGGEAGVETDEEEEEEEEEEEPRRKRQRASVGGTAAAAKSPAKSPAKRRSPAKKTPAARPPVGASRRRRREEPDQGEDDEQGGEGEEVDEEDEEDEEGGGGRRGRARPRRPATTIRGATAGGTTRKGAAAKASSRRRQSQRKTNAMEEEEEEEAEAEEEEAPRLRSRRRAAAKAVEAIHKQARPKTSTRAGSRRRK